MQLPFIDNRRMALYGKVLCDSNILKQCCIHPNYCCRYLIWLYPPLQAFGGYMALKMLAATDQLFKCAAVMAPITDFRFYSRPISQVFSRCICSSAALEHAWPIWSGVLYAGAAFSERYFGLPSKDESAYVVRTSELWLWSHKLLVLKPAQTLLEDSFCLLASAQ